MMPSQIPGKIMAGGMHDVLQGLLVVELGTMVTAPLAGMMLADMGARVIKVELPETGDPFRSHGGGRYSPPFVAYNRGKESIQIDLRSPVGLANLVRLLERADVVLENFRPGVMNKMGLGNAALNTINPRPSFGGGPQQRHRWDAGGTQRAGGGPTTGDCHGWRKQTEAMARRRLGRSD